MEKEDAATGTPAEIAHAVHELRNGMNTLLMNAAVLGSRADDVPESLRPFVERIKQSTKSCSDELARLFELIDAREKR